MPAPLTELPSGTHLLPRLYAHAAGPLSAAYYRHHFERMEAHSQPVVAWNHAAAWNTLGWLCLRRMWLAAALYAACVAAAAVLWWTLVRPHLGSSAALLTAAGLAALAVVVPGLWGTYGYYRHLRAHTLQALQAADTLAQAQQQLGALAITPERRNATAAAQAALAVLAAAGALAGAPAGPTKPSAAPPANGPPVLHFPSAPALQPPAPAAATPPAVIAPVQAPESTPAPVPAAPVPAAPTATLRDAPAEPAPSPAPVRASKTAGASASPAALVPGKFYLNVGVFAQVANADNAERALRQAGLPVLRSTVPSAKGSVVRLRSGPFESAQQARAAQRAAAQQQLEATVFQASRKR